MWLSWNPLDSQNLEGFSPLRTSLRFMKYETVSEGTSLPHT